MPNGPGISLIPGSERIKEEKCAVPFAGVTGLIFAGAALAGMLLLSSCQKSPDLQATPKEDQAYASQMKPSDLRLSAEENFLGQQVVYLDGKMTNQGSKVVRQLKIRLFFHDTLNQVVLREEQEIVNAQGEFLKPGQTRSFQIRLDQIPDSWNRQVPELQIVSVQTQHL